MFLLFYLFLKLEKTYQHETILDDVVRDLLQDELFLMLPHSQAFVKRRPGDREVSLVVIIFFPALHHTGKLNEKLEY